MITPDPYQLNRFLNAQDGIYNDVLKELHNGFKETHWMWFVFPQLKGLGFSPAAQLYGLSGIDEAKAYLENPILKSRLEDCIKAVIASGVQNPRKVFGYPDYLKFQSCLTLFSMAAPENKLFKKALELFYSGVADDQTESLIKFGTRA